MQIFEIKYLNCEIPENRRKLLKETMLALRIDKKPSIKELEGFSRKIGKKYGQPVKLVKQIKEKILVSVVFNQGAFTCFEATSYYEALCKHILMVKHYKDSGIVVAKK